MKIYTKTGDKGETGLFGGDRVKKSAVRISAYGEIDEANALIGAARSLAKNSEFETILQKIQNDLFDIGALLATPDKKKISKRSMIVPADIEFLEKTIDRFEGELPPLKNFILAGGSPLASLLHIARTVARRAERTIVALNETEPVASELLIYVNRLSDLLFVLARAANQKAGVADILWQQKG